MLSLQNAAIQVEQPNFTFRDLSDQADIRPSQLQQQSFQSHQVLLSDLRIWDAMNTLLTTAASDDCGIATGTPGTDSPFVTGGDVKDATTTRKFAFELAVPPNYDDGFNARIRLRAGMRTTVASSAATIDIEAFRPNGSGGVGSDLCVTSAQSINSLTPGNFDFDLSVSTLDPGDKIICIVTISVVDSATATAVIPAVYDIRGMLHTRG